MKGLFGKAGLYFRFLQAGLVLWLDQKRNRDPKVVDRLRHLRAQQAWLEMMMANPASREKMPADLQQNYKMLGPSIRMLESAIKKNPDLTMKQITEMAQKPQLQEPRVRTRPGPPPPRGRRG